MISNLSAPFDRPLQLARQAASEGEVPVGAIILLNGSLIGEGRNARETRPSPLAHAEIDAIAEAAKKLGAWRLVGAELWVTLEPCPMCLAAAQQARVSRVVYGAKDPKGGALSLGYRLHEDPRTNHRFEVEYRETPECAELLRQFFKDLR